MSDLADVRERLRAVEEKQEIAERRLFGNGQPGEIAHIFKKLRRIDRLLMYLLFAEALSHFASGAGVVSLRSLLELLGKFG